MAGLRLDLPIRTSSPDAAETLAEAQAAGSTQLGRGYEAGRIGTEINALAAEEAGLRARGLNAQAEPLRQRIGGLQRQAAIFAPTVNRVEDVNGVGGAIDYGMGQVGQGAASMLDPMAAAGAINAVGRVAGVVPHPVAQAVSRVSQLAAPLAAYGINQRQLTGETYNSMVEDPALMARTTPQQRNTVANTSALGQAALDTAFPAVAARRLTGMRGIPGTSRLGAGARTGIDLGLEGGTELAQQKIQQETLGHLNPSRDTSGDASDLLNSFVGGAIGAGPISAAANLVESGSRRLGAGVDRVKAKAGEVIDLAGDGAAALRDSDVGKKVSGLVDKFKANAGDTVDLQEVASKLAEGAGRATSRAREELDEFNGLSALSPDRLPQDVQDLMQAKKFDDPRVIEAISGQDQKRVDLVSERLKARAESGDQEAATLLAGLESQDPVARDQAADAGAAYLQENNRLGRAAAFAGTAVSRSLSIAKKAGGAAADFARGAKSAFDKGRKLNAQTVDDGEGADVSFAQWSASEWGAEQARRSTAGEQALRALAPRAETAALYMQDMAKRQRKPIRGQYTLAKEMAFELATLDAGFETNVDGARAQRAGQTPDALPERNARLNRLAEKIDALFGPRAQEVMGQVASMLPAGTKPKFDYVTQELAARQADPGGHMQRTAVSRDALGQRMLEQVAPDKERELLAQGINLRTESGRESLAELVSSFAESGTPKQRAALDAMFGRESVGNMLGLVGERPEADVAVEAPDYEESPEDNVDVTELTGVDEERIEAGSFEERMAQKALKRGGDPATFTYRANVRRIEGDKRKNVYDEGDTRFFDANQRLSEAAGGGSVLEFALNKERERLGDNYDVEAVPAATFLKDQGRPSEDDLTNQFVIRATRASPRDEGAMEPAEFQRLADAGTKVQRAARTEAFKAQDESARAQVYDERNLIFFQDANKPEQRVPMLAGELATWGMKRKSALLDEGAKGGNAEFLAGLMEGIGAVLASNRVGAALPYRVTAEGKKQSFKNGLPPSLKLRDGTVADMVEKARKSAANTPITNERRYAPLDRERQETEAAGMTVALDKDERRDEAAQTATGRKDFSNDRVVRAGEEGRPTTTRRLQAQQSAEQADVDERFPASGRLEDEFNDVAFRTANSRTSAGQAAPALSKMQRRVLKQAREELAVVTRDPENPTDQVMLRTPDGVFDARQVRPGHIQVYHDGPNGELFLDWTAPNPKAAAPVAAPAAAPQSTTPKYDAAARREQASLFADAADGKRSLSKSSIDDLLAAKGRAVASLRAEADYMDDSMSDADVLSHARKNGVMPGGKLGNPLDPNNDRYELTPGASAALNAAERIDAEIQRRYDANSKPAPEVAGAKQGKSPSPSQPVGAAERSSRPVPYKKPAWARYFHDGYEVSSAGDKRFSALFARLKDGRTIEEAYQLDVKGYRARSNNWRTGKGKPPLDPATDTRGEYLKLWQQWAAENPGLIEQLRTASAGRVLTDVFANTPLSQAWALSEILAAKPERKLNAQATQIHQDLGRRGIAATHDSPNLFDGVFDWRSFGQAGTGAMVKGAGTYLSTGEGSHKYYKAASTAKRGAPSPSYQVTLDIEPRQLLDWDKPLAQQLPSLRLRATKAIREHNLELTTADRGEDLYRELSQALGGDRQASDYLQAHGVLGHTYQAADGPQGKAPNYVVYDDSKIQTNFVAFDGRNLNAQGVDAFHISNARHDGNFDWRKNWRSGQGDAFGGAGTYLTLSEADAANFKDMMRARMTQSQFEGNGYRPGEPATYSVTLNAHEGEMMLWGAPLSKQPPGVAEKLIAALKDAGISDKTIADIKAEDEPGSEIYRYYIYNRFFSLPKVSDLLQKHGLVGHFQRSARGMHAVVYDDNRITTSLVTLNAQRVQSAAHTSQVDEITVYGEVFDANGGVLVDATAVEPAFGAASPAPKRFYIDGQTSDGDYFSSWHDSRAQALAALHAETGVTSAATPRQSFADDVPLNAQRRGDGVATDADMAEAREYVRKVLGAQVKTEFTKIFAELNGRKVEMSGEYVDAENAIKLSTAAGPGVLQVAYHEAMHALWARLGGHPVVREMLVQATNDPVVLARIQGLLSREPHALAQLGSAEERVAYAYQFWRAGLLNMGKPATTVFQKVKRFLKRVAGMVKDSDRALELFEAFHQGSLAEPSAAGRVLNEIAARGRWPEKARKQFDRQLQALVKGVMPAESILLRTESAAAKQLARDFFTNPGDAEAGQYGEGYLNARRRMTARYLNQVKDALEGMNEKDIELVTRYLQQGLKPSAVAFPPHAQAVARVQNLLDNYYDYARAAGLDLGYAEDRYFPRVWDVEKLYAKKAEFIGMLKTKYAGVLETALTSARANEDYGDVTKPTTVDEVAERMWKRLVDRGGVEDKVDAQRDDGVLSPFFESQNGRDFKWLDDRADVEPFLDKDAVGQLTRYFRQGVRAAEYTRRFGRDGHRLKALIDERRVPDVAPDGKPRRDHIDGPPLFKTIPSVVEMELRESAAAEGLEGDAAKAWVARRLSAVHDSIGAMEGTLGKDISVPWRNATSWIMVYQNLRLLPLALFSSIVDPMGLVARGGSFQDAYDGFLRGLREVFRNWKDAYKGEPEARVRDEWEKLAEAVGAVDSQHYLDSLGEAYASSYLAEGARRINNKMFMINGMEGWNRAMRVQATKSAVMFIERHAGSKDRDSVRWMKEIGLEQGATMRDGKLVTDPRLLAVADNIPIDQARAALAPVHAAITRWVDGAVLTPNAAQRPPWASDPHWAVLFHLKQFTYSFHQTIIKRAVNELQEGNLGPIGAFIWYVPVMIASDIVKGVIQGGGDLPTYMKAYSAGDWLMHGVQRAGLLGVGQLGVDAYQDMFSVLGPAVEQVTDALADPADRTLVRALPFNGVYREALL